MEATNGAISLQAKPETIGTHINSKMKRKSFEFEKVYNKIPDEKRLKNGRLEL